jgi:glutamine amidotransferase
MARSIVVVDYGMGNLRSVSKAIEHVCAAGDQVLVTDDPQRIADADRIVFPGQGAARDCMAAISDHQLNQAILNAAKGKPFLGICMGLQVLMEFSEENGGTPLLGLFPGEVRRFPNAQDAQGNRLKVPHMGWSEVQQTREHPLWQGIEPNARFYFVHSYFVEPTDTDLTVGATDYASHFTAALASNNLFAVQFHPEKSADAGLRLLRNFVEWQI